MLLLILIAIILFVAYVSSDDTNTSSSVGKDKYTDLTNGTHVWKKDDGSYTNYDGHTIDYVNNHVVYDRDDGTYHQIM